MEQMFSTMEQMFSTMEQMFSHGQSFDHVHSPPLIFGFELTINCVIKTAGLILFSY